MNNLVVAVLGVCSLAISARASLIITSQVGQVTATTSGTLTPDVRDLAPSGSDSITASANIGWVSASASLNLTVSSNQFIAEYGGAGFAASLPNADYSASSSASIRVDFLISAPGTLTLRLPPSLPNVSLNKSTGEQIFFGNNPTSQPFSLDLAVLAGDAFWISSSAGGSAIALRGFATFTDSRFGQFQVSYIPTPSGAVLLLGFQATLLRRSRRR
jgi:hypothetical protein